MNWMTIGQLARKVDVGVETIRFYERQGLIPEPPRSRSGYRQYAETTVDRLRFIRRAKELGFSLRETDELISLRLDQGASATMVRAQAEEKIRDIEDRIRDLQRVRSSLAELVDSCGCAGPGSECPILRALSGDEGREPG
jgi:MerR family transcriptional regulator, copper efflux regulator